MFVRLRERLAAVLRQVSGGDDGQIETDEVSHRRTLAVSRSLFEFLPMERRATNL